MFEPKYCKRLQINVRCLRHKLTAARERTTGSTLNKTMRKLSFALLVNFLLVFFLFSSANAQWTPKNPVISFQKQADGVVFTMQSGTLKVLVCSDSIIHV